MSEKIFIRAVVLSDADRVWSIFHEVLQKGDTHALAPDTTKTEGVEFWFSPRVKTFVACTDDNLVVGVYRVLSNQTGLGSHVANGGYIVDSKYFGRGIARKMAEHSFNEAKKLGFIAMQYNFVVSTNTSAVHLWQSVGFKIVGTSPKSFNHISLGLVDTYIMHKFL